MSEIPGAPVLLKTDMFGHGHPHTELLFFCPACKCTHGVSVTNGGGWTWNESMDRPTFSPAILVRGFSDGRSSVCHSFVRNGQVEFLADCTHSLAGHTVPLEAF